MAALLSPVKRRWDTHTMRPLFISLAAGLVAVLFVSPGRVAGQSASLRGFPDDAARAERTRETQFRAIPDSARLRDYMLAMAGDPHVAGQPASRKVAEYALEKFRSWGLSASIETFEALMPWPVETRGRACRTDEIHAPRRGTSDRRGS